MHQDSSSVEERALCNYLSNVIAETSKTAWNVAVISCMELVLQSEQVSQNTSTQKGNAPRLDFYSALLELVVAIGCMLQNCIVAFLIIIHYIPVATPVVTTKYTCRCCQIPVGVAHNHGVQATCLDTGHGLQDLLGKPFAPVSDTTNIRWTH